ncbi:hypothetical protein B7988_05405 [Fibrobacter sp. UWB1]|jgi:hypothetical protein|uniref:hypothetical protein n=1 Tax=Fibrobacter sp. UWB1 TaxID=1964355 RepID=UPI000B5209D4|nr:hypothetical protein [Fibrobacter sp. UWB1]OWV26598.1 hypothetical protein B7988_05405 [Fibrobacter sp. UWB1]
MVKYTLIGLNGNAYSIMAYVCDALKQERENMELASDEYETIKADYLKDAMSGDYNHLLCVSFDMIERINKDIGCDISDDDQIVLNKQPK